MIHPGDTARCGRSRARLAGAALALLLVGSDALATQVYHSPNDDGVPAGGSPTVGEGGVQSVFLYIDGGAAPSLPDTACDQGLGDEVCGYTVTLTGLAGLTLASFNPDPGADVLYDSTALELRLNGLDTASPGVGPQRIGELLVNAVPGGLLKLTTGEVVGADLASEILAESTVVTVPEPTGALQLLGGIALLLGIGGRRARQ